MAYLVIRKIKGGSYYYIAKSTKKEGRVVQKTLEYLGREPDARRLKRACSYWKVSASPKEGKRRGEV